MLDYIQINKQKIYRGESARVEILIDRLPTNTEIKLPIFIYRGKEDGPTMLLTAGLHGDEINGIEIIRRLIARKNLKVFKGTIIAIPIVNVYGFIQNIRALPDGKDLNRSFPGNKNGTLAQRVAYILMNEIIPLIDFGVDFHTGGANLNNYPQIRCVLDIPMNRKLAKVFAPPFIVNAKFINKSFRKAANKEGKHIVVYEAGESQRIDEYVIQEGINGAIRMMHHFGMVKKNVLSTHNTQILNERKWLRAKHGGLFKSDIQIGEKVIEEQEIGIISDPFGDLNHIIKAPYSGYVFGINNSAVINAGDALFHIGKMKR